MTIDNCRSFADCHLQKEKISPSVILSAVGASIARPRVPPSFAFPLRGRWRGEAVTDEVGWVALRGSSMAIANRDTTSSAPFGGTFPSRGRLCVRPVAHSVRRYD